MIDVSRDDRTEGGDPTMPLHRKFDVDYGKSSRELYENHNISPVSADNVVRGLLKEAFEKKANNESVYLPGLEVRIYKIDGARTIRTTQVEQKLIDFISNADMGDIVAIHLRGRDPRRNDDIIQFFKVVQVEGTPLLRYMYAPIITEPELE